MREKRPRPRLAFCLGFPHGRAAVAEAGLRGQERFWSEKRADSRLFGQVQFEMMNSHPDGNGVQSTGGGGLYSAKAMWLFITSFEGLYKLSA